jgi:polar amino acid transport system substrate-binding protein
VKEWIERTRTAAFASLALSLSFVDSGSAQEGLAIRIAVEGAYPPFNYIEQNELQGFEVDLLKALCSVMEARCTFVSRDWDGIIGGLLKGEYDAIMSSLEITARREKRIAFSRRYYLVPAAFVAPKESVIDQVTPEALAGKRIGAVERSEQAAFMEKVYKQAELRFYGKLEEANLDLLAGRLDLVIGDKLALSNFLGTREGSCCRFVADVPADPAYFGRGYGVGLRKQDQELKAKFDRAIERVIADGTYDRIRTKYFRIDIK